MDDEVTKATNSPSVHFVERTWLEGIILGQRTYDVKENYVSSQREGYLSNGGGIETGF